MNMSGVISSIISQLGLYGITLPFKDDITGKTIPTENVVRDVLVKTTIPIYSQFVPWKRECTCNIADLKCLDHKRAIYLLPAWLTITEIMYVSDVELPMHNYRGTYGDISPAYGINRSVQGVMTSQAYMMVAGQMRAEPSFEYLGENKIRLYGYPKCDVVFRVASEHDPSGETIPDSCRDSFMQLALLDVKEFLYENLKLYDEIPSAFGSIKLQIQGYSNASSDKENLLNEWRGIFHVDDTDLFQFM